MSASIDQRAPRMLLVDALPISTPADAERLLADLWQLTSGRRLGLFLVGLSGRVMVGVSSSHLGIEEAVAATVATQGGGRVEAGWFVAEMVYAAADVAAVGLLPTERHLRLESSTFGWQRTDPLRATFLALRDTTPGAVTAVALSLRSLPDLCFAMSLGVVAAGLEARARVASISATYGGVGVRLRRPVFQGRSARRMLSGSLRRPVSVHRVEAVAHFWHPPYGPETLVPGVAGAEPELPRVVARGENA